MNVISRSSMLTNVKRADTDESADTYQQIQDAALERLRTLGPEGISLRGVAKDANVSIGTVQYHFANREFLVEACLDHYHKELRAFEQEILSSKSLGGNPKDIVEAVVRKSMSFLEERRELAKLRLLLSTKKGELPSHRARLLKNGAEVLALWTGESEVATRAVLDSVVRLVVVYSTCSDQEACEITGLNDRDTARESLRKHLVVLAQKLIFGS